MNETVAIIPARGGSKRIPKKNIASIAGKPAITYPIAACLESRIFDTVYVTSDDEETRQISLRVGAEVLNRPARLCDSLASIHDVVRYHLNEFESAGDLPTTFCIVYATAVFLEARYLAESKTLMDSTETDFVLAVRSLKPHPFKALMVEDDRLQPVFKEEFVRKSQFYPEYFAPAGYFHWMRTRAFLDGTDIWAQRRKPYVLEPHVAIDIDEPDDLDLAHRLMAVRQT